MAWTSFGFTKSYWPEHYSLIIFSSYSTWFLSSWFALPLYDSFLDTQRLQVLLSCPKSQALKFVLYRIRISQEAYQRKFHQNLIASHHHLSFYFFFWGFLYTFYISFVWYILAKLSESLLPLGFHSFLSIYAKISEHFLFFQRLSTISSIPQVNYEYKAFSSDNISTFSHAYTYI